MTEKQAFEILKKYSNAPDARVVLGGIVGVQKLNNSRDFDLSVRERIRVYRAARQLRRGMGPAKILQKKWFYGMEFETGVHTLDPRPDSETLVSAVLESGPVGDVNILDMGTGTGCLIISIVSGIDGASGAGIDKSYFARRVACRNVRRLGCAGRIRVRAGTFKRPRLGEKFDIIISNPPYIAIGDTRVDGGAMHDPKMALYSGADGLNAYREIAVSAKKLLKPDGCLFLEIGIGMGRDVRAIFERDGWQFLYSKNDLASIERVLVFEKN